MKKRIKGFTLVELILYVALISIFLTGAVYFTWDVIYGREKAYNQQVVDQNASIILSKIGYEITKAKNIQSITNTELVLDNYGTTVAITYLSEKLQITPQGSGANYLTSNQIKIVNTDIFTDLSSPDGNSKNVKVKLQVEQNQSAIPGQPPASSLVESSFELKGQFNQARGVLLDLSNMTYVGGNIGGVHLQNTSSSDLTIDKMIVSWTGTLGGENITGVQIDLGTEEWSGSQTSGSELDLADYTLSAGANIINIDYISFDANIAGATLKLEFVMSDGSTSVGLGYLQTATVTPTNTPVPTATSTPSPTNTPGPTSCSTLCVGAGYGSGVCLKNASSCSTAGYFYLSSGNQYCTGGANADTCCCVPK